MQLRDICILGLQQQHTGYRFWRRSWFKCIACSFTRGQAASVFTYLPHAPIAKLRGRQTHFRGNKMVVTCCQEPMREHKKKRINGLSLSHIYPRLWWSHFPALNSRSDWNLSADFPQTSSFLSIWWTPILKCGKGCEECPMGLGGKAPHFQAPLSARYIAHFLPNGPKKGYRKRISRSPGFARTPFRRS